MFDSFELPVTYKGEELLLPSRLIQQGYTHKFLVDIHGSPVQFEPDEERNYRAIIDTETITANNKLDIELLKAIANAIEAVVK